MSLAVTIMWHNKTNCLSTGETPIPNSIKQDPWETDSHLAALEIPPPIETQNLQSKFSIFTRDQTGNHLGLDETSRHPHTYMSIFSSSLCLGLPRYLLPSGFLITILYAFLILYTSVTCPINLGTSDTITPLTFYHHHNLLLLHLSTRDIQKISSVCEYCCCSTAVTMVRKRAEFLDSLLRHGCNLQTSEQCLRIELCVYNV